MNIVIDLEDFRKQSDILLLEIKEMLEVGGDLATLGVSLKEVLGAFWEFERMKPFVSMLTMGQSQTKEPMVEGAILGLCLFSMLMDHLAADYMAQRADDVSQEEHGAVWLASHDLVVSRTLSRLGSVLTDIYCAKIGREGRAPIWTITQEVKGETEGEAEKVQ